MIGERVVAEINIAELLYAQAAGVGRVWDYSRKVREVNQSLLNRYPLTHWIEEGFGIWRALSKTSGDFIELAGPTQDGYKLVGVGNIKDRTGRELIVTNLNVPFWVGDNPEKLITGIDARNLPYEPNSLGAIFVSCLPTDAREKVSDESYRVLEPNGVFVYQACLDIDIAHALELGFRLRQYQRENPDFLYRDMAKWHAIFTK